MLRRRLAIVMTAVAGCAVLAACGAGGGGDSGSGGTIRVAANSNATMLPFWVAQKEGMFDKAGLKVQLTTIENVSTLPPALGKQFDIALSTPTLVISSNKQGLKISWVSGSSVDSSKVPSGELLVGKDSGVTKLSQLNGKKIGVLNESGTLHIATQYWLKQNGVDLKSLDVVQVDGPSQADQIKSGRIDAVESVTPFTGQIKAAGATSLGVPYRALAPTIAPIMFASQTSWAKGHSDDVAKFRKVLKQGAAWIKAHDSDARQVLQEKLKYPAGVVEKLTLPQFDTAVRTGDLPIWYKAMKATTGFTYDGDLSALAFNGGK